MNKNKLKLTIPNNLKYLPIVLNVVRNVAESMGFDKNEITKLEVGAEEAVSNVIKYGFPEEEDANFDVILESLPLGLKIIIKEKGLPFDPTLIPKFSKKTLERDLKARGLGTYLMNQCIDEVTYHNLGKEGIETHLFKHLNNKQIHQMMDIDELSDVDKEKSEEQLPKGSVKFSIRRMKPEEAVEVSKCAYSSYGYSYINEDIYYPDRVRELNKTDELISFVAVTDKNEIIAHSALEQENKEKIPELGAAFTKPKYRGQGCLNALTIEILSEARRRNLTGVYALAITTHPFSQKTLIKFGFKDCAIKISSGGERTYKGIEQKIIQRESVMFMFYYTKQPKNHILYVPKHHKEMIKGIYDHLGVSPEIIIPEKKIEFPENPASTHVKSNQRSKTADIMVDSYGIDIMDIVKRNLKAICLLRFETIYLYLKLDNPITALLTEEFEKMGFFFSGIMPGSTGNDELILQYLNNYVIDYSQLKIASDKGNEMLAYIRQRDPNLKK